VKKNSTAKPNTQRDQVARACKLTIGIDLGDRTSRHCILNEEGEVLVEGSVATAKSGMSQVFGGMPRCRIAMETGAHSPWVSQQLSEFGHEVIVANARNVHLICESTRKDDRLDASSWHGWRGSILRCFVPCATIVLRARLSFR
jgi:transposase